VQVDKQGEMDNCQVSICVCELYLRMGNTKVGGREIWPDEERCKFLTDATHRSSYNYLIFSLSSRLTHSSFAPCPLYRPPHKDIQLAPFPRSKREPQGLSCRLSKTRGLNTPQPARLAPAPSFFPSRPSYIQAFPFPFFLFSLSPSTDPPPSPSALRLGRRVRLTPFIVCQASTKALCYWPLYNPLPPQRREVLGPS